MSEQTSNVKIGLKDFIEKTFGITQADDITLQQIINNMMNADSNLPLKTQIDNPRNYTALKHSANVFGKLRLKNSSNEINKYIKTRNKYMISFKRRGRKEVFTTISSYNKDIDHNTSSIKSGLE